MLSLIVLDSCALMTAPVRATSITAVSVILIGTIAPERGQESP
jgi:hypothetical protein